MLQYRLLYYSRIMSLIMKIKNELILNLSPGLTKQPMSSLERLKGGVLLSISKRDASFQCNKKYASVTDTWLAQPPSLTQLSNLPLPLVPLVQYEPLYDRIP